MKNILVSLLFLFPFLVHAQGSHNNTSQQKGQAILGAGMNAASGAMYYSMCSAERWYFCVMGAMSYGQAAMTLAGGMASGRTADALDPASFDIPTFNDSGGLGDLGNVSNTGGLQNNSGLSDAIKDGLNKAQENGISLDPNTGKLTTKNGSYNSSDFASGSAMAGAGIIGSGEIGDVDAAIAKANGSAQKYASGFKFGKNKFGSAGGGGGFGGGKGYKAASNEPFDYASLFGKKKGGKNAEAITTSGMVKMVNGSPIGVGSDNIFDMVRRRYADHIKNKKYIEK